MNEELFWKMIDKSHAAHKGNMDEKCTSITEDISKLSKSDAFAFIDLFNAKMDAAYQWPLWGAAYVLDGGCSDDAFMDFRASLISRGQKAFEQALSAPDSLADEEFDEEVWFYEGYQYAVVAGVEAAAGELPPRYAPHPSDPSGAGWSEDDDSLQRMFPKLWTASQSRYAYTPSINASELQLKSLGGSFGDF